MNLARQTKKSNSAQLLPAASRDPIIGELLIEQRKAAEAIDRLERLLLAGAAQPIARRLYTQAQLCEAIQCTRSYVHTLHGLGCPVIRVTDQPRYDLDDVIAWMKSRGQP